jgi:hypothetical protein
VPTRGLAGRQGPQLLDLFDPGGGLGMNLPMQYANIIQNIAKRSRRSNILLIGQLVNILNINIYDYIGHPAAMVSSIVIICII